MTAAVGEPCRCDTFGGTALHPFMASYRSGNTAPGSAMIEIYKNTEPGVCSFINLKHTLSICIFLSLCVHAVLAASFMHLAAGNHIYMLFCLGFGNKNSNTHSPV